MPDAGLAGDGVAGHDRHRDRQEDRQHDRQRGGRVQRPAGQHRRQQGRALAGRRREVGDRDEHGDQHGQPAQQRRGSPSCAGGGPASTSSTRIIARSPSPAEQPGRRGRARAGHRRAPRPPASAAPAAISVTRTPAATSRALSAAGPASATTQPVAVALLDLAVQQRTRPGRRRGCARSTRPVGARSVARSSCRTSRPRFDDADPGAQLLDLAQLVAGQEHRGAGRVELDQQVADLPDALRVQAVGRLVQDEQPRACAAARRPGRAAGACRASTA